MCCITFWVPLVITLITVLKKKGKEVSNLNSHVQYFPF
jgi:hypothetical protein